MLGKNDNNNLQKREGVYSPLREEDVRFSDQDDGKNSSDQVIYTPRKRSRAEVRGRKKAETSLDKSVREQEAYLSTIKSHIDQATDERESLRKEITDAADYLKSLRKEIEEEKEYRETVRRDYKMFERSNAESKKNFELWLDEGIHDLGTKKIELQNEIAALHMNHLNSPLQPNSDDPALTSSQGVRKSTEISDESRLAFFESNKGMILKIDLEEIASSLSDSAIAYVMRPSGDPGASFALGNNVYIGFPNGADQEGINAGLGLVVRELYWQAGYEGNLLSSIQVSGPVGEVWSDYLNEARVIHETGERGRGGFAYLCRKIMIECRRSIGVLAIERMSQPFWEDDRQCLLESLNIPILLGQVMRDREFRYQYSLNLNIGSLGHSLVDVPINYVDSIVEQHVNIHDLQSLMSRVATENLPEIQDKALGGMENEVVGYFWNALQSLRIESVENYVGKKAADWDKETIAVYSAVVSAIVGYFKQYHDIYRV